MRRTAPVLLAAALAAVALLSVVPSRAEAQGSAQVYRDPDKGLLVYVADLSGRQPGEVRVGYTTPVFWFFNPFDPLEPGFGCAFVTPQLPHLVFCQEPFDGLLVQLGPGPNDIRVLPSVPVLPGPNVIKGNRAKDKIQGGKAGERINAGKGKDVVNPGKGKDVVNLGAGDDKANTRDGKPDKVNGGPGDDEATVDKKDKVKNVEVVRRK